ncbi:MAG: CoA-binding protein [bacterium]|nr:CoA-binding protein [bacterium]
MSFPDAIRDFLGCGAFAVVGASSNRDKYGNKVLRCYAQHQLPVVGVNPKLESVEGRPCHPNLQAAVAAKPVAGPLAASVVAPPMAAESIVGDALAAGVKHLWFQPGAEDVDASAAARQAGIQVIDDGSCLLVALGFRDE